MTMEYSKFELESITQQVILIAKEVANYIQKESETFNKAEIQTKSKNDFVSYVDQEAEKKLVQKLGELMPEAGFITEEGTVEQGGKAYCWIIDPLDGTTNFIHNSTPFAVSIALAINMEPIIGVVHEITRNETFYAWKGGNAFLDGTQIQVSSTKTLEESIICTGRPHNYVERLKELMASIGYFLEHTHGLRTTGSAAADLAYVACGRFDGRYEFGLKAWDIAAGVLLIKEAGGDVCDFNGGDNYMNNGFVVAGNAAILHPLQKKLNEIFTARYS